jgi:hypothetical protein
MGYWDKQEPQEKVKYLCLLGFGEIKVEGIFLLAALGPFKRLPL